MRIDIDADTKQLMRSALPTLGDALNSSQVQKGLAEQGLRVDFRQLINIAMACGNGGSI